MPSFTMFLRPFDINHPFFHLCSYDSSIHGETDCSLCAILGLVFFSHLQEQRIILSSHIIFQSIFYTLLLVYCGYTLFDVGFNNRSTRSKNLVRQLKKFISNGMRKICWESLFVGGLCDSLKNLCRIIVAHFVTRC